MASPQVRLWGLLSAETRTVFQNQEVAEEAGYVQRPACESSARGTPGAGVRTLAHELTAQEVGTNVLAGNHRCSPTSSPG